MSEANIVLFTPLHLSDSFSNLFFSNCPLLLSQNHVSSNVVIQNVNYSDTLKDEVFLYGLKKLEIDASLWIKVLVYK